MLAGNNPASEGYVRSKTKTAAELGIYSETVALPGTVSTGELIGAVDALNARCDIDGILVQLPLPPHVDSQAVLLRVSPEKDVDGFHPCNAGLLATGRPGFRPCTPAGIVVMLKRYGIAMEGQNAAVVGRSDIVGKPVALLLLQENATVTICHSQTRDLAAMCRTADILIAAIGKPAIITADYIRPGAVVVDVGINRIESRELAGKLLDPPRFDAFEKRGSAIVGDVHPGDMMRLASAYTPVPGGVGPLTIAMLMSNTVRAAERRLGLSDL